MTQPNNTTNWVIQGSNGQPQMFKFVQSANKPITGIMSGQQLKIFKSPGSHADTSQAFSGTQVLRTIGSTVSTPKIVTKSVPMPVGVGKVTKTIRLTPSQMQQIRLGSPNIPKSQQQIHNNTTIPVISTQKTISPPILSRKRQEDPLELDYMPESKRSRKTDSKAGKGLRHFSMKVCEKVKQKGTTTYNEVADELVGEFSSDAVDQYDQKNIRRRVYDALNVLMAMNIISKEKKEIKWIGLPTNSLQECHQLQNEIKKKEKAIKEKQNQLNDLILNQIVFKLLAQRNKEAEKIHGAPVTNSYIKLPFIVVSTNKKTVINCSISNDKMEYFLQFSDKFEINDDVEILKSIGMLKGLDTGECSPEDLEKIKTLVPQCVWPYVDDIASGKTLEAAGSSSMMSLSPEDFVEATMDEENSRPSSSLDPMSPSGAEYSDDDVDSDISSDTELN